MTFILLLFAKQTHGTGSLNLKMRASLQFTGGSDEINRRELLVFPTAPAKTDDAPDYGAYAS